MTTLQLLVSVSGILLAGLVAGVLLRRRRAREWRRFARDLGLRLAEGSFGPVIAGEVGGRRIEGRLGPTGSDGEALGLARVSLALELRRGLPAGMRIVSAGPVLGPLNRALEGAEPTGDEEVDRWLVIHGGGGVEALGAAREALVRLVRAEHPDLVEVEGNRISLSWADRVADAAELRRRALALRDAAEALDGRAGA